MRDGISIIIPACSEEKNIPIAVRNVKKAVRGILDYEIIIVDDGSADDTGKVIDRLHRKDPGIRVFHFPQNKGIGNVFKLGIREARKPYIGGFPGDSDMAWTSLRNLIKSRKKADIITSYMVNPGKRTPARRVLSRTYVIIMNLVFGLRLKYFNGYFVARADKLKKLKLKSNGFTVFVEVIIRLLKRGATYKEVPFSHTGRKYGNSKSVSVKNLLNSFKMMVKLINEVYLSKTI